MIRPLLLAALLAAPLASAQTTVAPSSDPALAPAVAAFEADLARVVRLATAAALVHERTGAFPRDAFGLLGPDEGARTGASREPLSALTMEAPPAAAPGAVGAFTVVPLPVAPYVREDTPARVLLLRRPDGFYEAQYRITRLRAPEDGGARTSYARAARYDVREAVGSFCIEPGRARALLAEGSFTPDPARLSAEPLTIRVVDDGPRLVGDPSAPAYYETSRGGAR